MLVFNFQKMMDMLKGYAYQFSNFIAFKKIATKNLEPNKNLLENWTLVLWRELPNCNTSSLT